MCFLHSCSVCPCEEDEIPKPWIEEVDSSSVDRTIDDSSFISWSVNDGSWIVQDDKSDESKLFA